VRLKPRTKIILIACLLLALVWVWVAFQESEPSYKGRTLSFWLTQYRPNDMRIIPVADAREAAAAVKAIGTDALPVLVEWLRYEPGAVRKWTLNAAVRLPAKMFRSAFVQDHLIATTPDLRADQAVRGFEILGPAAAPAIPDLVRLVNTPNADFSAARSLYALGYIGPAALPELTKMIQDPHQPHRTRAIEMIGYMREWDFDVSSMNSVLLRCLTDTNRFVQMAATNALLTIAPEVLTNAPAQ
jgi:HEAT repeat protein